MKLKLKIGGKALLAGVLLICMATPAHASCLHDWQLEEGSESNYQRVSDTQHSYKAWYYCDKCDEEKTETVLENHHWEYYDDCINYKKISDTQHSYQNEYICEECNAIKTETILENHNWDCYDDGTNYKQVSSAKHSFEKEYHCDDCDAEKTETVLEDHHWQCASEYIDEKNISATKHVLVKELSCYDCGAKKIEKTYQNHRFDKYGICKDCGYEKQTTITLKPKKTAYVNGKTWIKVDVKKNGYLVFNSSAGTIKIYNKSKRMYAESGMYFWSSKKTDRIPVLKGSYYFKITSPSKAFVKYTFKADKPVNNYTIKTAKSLKKGTKITGVIHSGAKKKTWTRYYKIKLTKKQFLNISYDGIYPWVCKANGDYVSLTTKYDKNGNNTGLVSNYKLNKGVYYLELEKEWTPATKKNDLGRVYDLKWN